MPVFLNPAPEEISSDGGPEFTAFVTPDFMRKWNIKHRVSSAYFPQFNGRVEVALKAAKRLLMSNISPNADLNNDSFLGRSLMYKEKRTGPRTEPWETPLRRRKGRLYELQIRTFERRSER